MPRTYCPRAAYRNRRLAEAAEVACLAFFVTFCLLFLSAVALAAVWPSTVTVSMGMGFGSILPFLLCFVSWGASGYFWSRS